MTGKEEIANLSYVLPTGIKPVTRSSQKSDALTRLTTPHLKNIRTYINMCTPMLAYTLAVTHIYAPYILTHADILADTHIHTYTQTHMHTYTHLHIHVHACVHKFRHTHTHKLIKVPKQEDFNDNHG